MIARMLLRLVMGLVLVSGPAAAREIEVPWEPPPFATPEAKKLAARADAGDFEGAQKEAARLVKRQPVNIELWMILGSLQAQTGNYAEAIVSLEKGLQGRATDLPFLLLLARIHEDRAELGPGGTRSGGMVSYKPSQIGEDAAGFKAGQLREAAGRYQKALVLQPDARLFQAKHAALLLAAGEATTAWTVLAEYLKANPDDADLCLQQAKAGVALERWPEARAAAERCVALRATEAEACLILATLAARENQAAAAEAWRRKARFHSFVPDFLPVEFNDENYGRIAPLIGEEPQEEAEGADEAPSKARREAAVAAIDRLIAQKDDTTTRLLGLIAWQHSWHGEVENRIYAELEERKAEGVLMALFDRAKSLCTVGSCVPALARLGSEAAFPLIVQRLPQDRNMFSMHLPEALAIYGRPEAVDPLGRALREAVADVRRLRGNDMDFMRNLGTIHFASRCLWALARFKGPEAREVLTEIALDKSYAVEATAALFLQTREVGYFQKLLKLLQKKPGEVEDIAARYRSAELPEAEAVEAIARKAPKKGKT